MPLLTPFRGESACHEASESPSEGQQRISPRLLVVVGALVMALLVMAVSAHAQGGGVAGNASNCSQYVGVANRIASCVLSTVDMSARVYYAQFYPYLANAILAVTVLGVVLYGVMVAAGMVEEIGRDTAMYLIKIAVVSFFVQNADFTYDAVYGMMNGAAAQVVSVVPSSGSADGGSTGFAQINCLNNMRNASHQQGAPVVGPWLAVDCMLDTVIGIKVPNADGSAATTDAALASNQKLGLKEQGVSRGLFFLFSSAMKTSVVGFMFGAIGMLFIWSLISLTIKTLFTYISGYMAVAFLIIISPLFIPLVLLPGEVPKAYFKKWYELLLGFALQPVLLLVFLMLFISAVDLAMFSGDYSVMYRIAGDASRQNGFNLNTYLTQNGGAINKQAVNLWQEKFGQQGPELIAVEGKNIIDGLKEVNCGKGVLTGQTDDATCKNVAQIKAYRDALDWDKLAAARHPAVVMEDGATTGGQAISREVLASTIFCAVILLVMNQLAGLIPTLLNDLTGGIGETPDLMQNVMSKLKSKVV